MLAAVMRTLHVAITAACLVSLGLAGCSGNAKTGEQKAEPAKPDAAEDEGEAVKPEPEPAEVEAPAPMAGAKVGEPAPDFTLPDLEGNEVSLASFKGKTVVLEWFNPGCPFVKFAHGEGPLASMGNEKMGDELVWLAINSGAPGKQGHDPTENENAVSGWAMKYPVLRDETGKVGKAYGAEKTPHVFVIDAEGVLRYKGALDNAPIGETQNEEYAGYLENALAQLAAGSEIDPSETAPYGCGVKYGS